MIKQYERRPQTPKPLNSIGETFWVMYCQYFLDRCYLTEDLLPAIETLSFLEQQRVELQQEIVNSRDDENIKKLK